MHDQNRSIHFRSTQALHRPAPKLYIRCAALFDAALLGLSWLTFLPQAATTPEFFLLLWLPLGLGMRLFLHALRLRTPGDHLWALAQERGNLGNLHGDSHPARPLIARRSTWQIFWRSPFQVTLFSLLSLGAIQIACIVSAYRFSELPNWKRLGIITLPLSHPSSVDATETGALPPLQWKTLPIYFALGMFPVRYQNEPVFHTIPYKKGPPVQFFDSLVARWQSPHTIATYEGPKTADTKLDRAHLRRCLTQSKILPPNLACQKAQQLLLARHLEETSRALPGLNKQPEFITWFEITHPRLLPSEQTEGVVIVATHQGVRHERRILISPGGIQQTFVLRSRSDDLVAIQTFDQSMRSIRMSDDLQAGRLWANEDVASISLADLPRPNMPGSGAPPSTLGSQPDRVPGTASTPQGQLNNQRIQRIADFQASLLGKLSVDPASMEALYHLGGLSYLLLDTPQSTPWSAAPLQLLSSLHQYAADVDAKSPRTQELQRMAKRAKQ